MPIVDEKVNPRHSASDLGNALRVHRLWLLYIWEEAKIIVPLITGIALCVFPYFIANVYALVLVGVVLVAIPYFVRL